MTRKKYQELWHALAPAYRLSIVRTLKEEIPIETQVTILNLIEENPDTWFAGYHFGWGMYIRNFLRHKGYTDDALPTGNWDDYYVQAVEEAVGYEEEKVT